MSEGFEVFRVLTAEWTVLAGGRPARDALARWSVQEPVLGGVGSLADLVGECHRRGDPARSAVLLGALVRVAGDPLAARVLLQALTPGLVKMVNRVQRQTPWVGSAGVWPTVGDVSAELVAYAVETIRGAAGRDVRWPQTVLLDGVWHRVWAAGRRWQRWGSGQLVLPFEHEVTHPAVELVALLAEAVERGRMSVADAELIRRYRVDDEPATVIAVERGCSAVALRARRERAEKVLAGLARAG